LLRGLGYLARDFSINELNVASFTSQNATRICKEEIIDGWGI